MIRYALLLRYTSAQSYKMLLEKFPLPSFSLLQKLHQGGVDSIKAAKILRDKGELCNDIILIADEMYVGASEEGEFYSGVVCFMISGLKKTVPTVIKACPVTTAKGKWVFNEFIKCLTNLADMLCLTYVGLLLTIIGLM